MENPKLLLLPALILIFSLAFISAVPITDESTFTVTGSTGQHPLYNGYIIIPNVNVSVISVGKSSSSDCPKAYLWSLGNRIAEANFIGDVATFSEPYPILYAGVKYSLVTGNDGGNCDSVYQVGTSYPYVGINVDFAGGINGVENENESQYYVALFPSDAPHDFINITTEEYFTLIVLPTSGGILNYDNLVDDAENAKPKPVITGEVITEPTPSFGLFSTINNFFVKIGAWFSNLFN